MTPDHCPFGHPLGPAHMSLTWDPNIREHRVYCNDCNGRTRSVQGSGQWEVHVDGRWIPYE